MFEKNVWENIPLQAATVKRKSLGYNETRRRVDERSMIKSILPIDRHLAHSRQNRAGGDGRGTNRRPSEVQHRDEELDDMDARDNVVDQSYGDVRPEVQPEGVHHQDSLDALVSQDRQKRSNLVVGGRRVPGRAKLSVCNR